MAEERKQTLVYSVIEFLKDSIADGTVKAEDQEGLEIAIQCIGEAFGVDPDNEEQTAKLSIKPATLFIVFDVFLKTRQRTQPGPTSAPEQAAAASSSSEQKVPSAADKAEAEKLKQKGNVLMTSKKYDEAIAEYTKAIELDSTTPVFYSNRAAAHASKGDHLSAIGDAEQAISIDPNFVKAYSRLGHAQFSIGDYEAAADAFERGLKLEPTNPNLKNGLDNATSRLTSEIGSSSVPQGTPTNRSAGGAPNFDDLLSGLGGGGGLPDMSSLFNNPALMQMANQLAASGGLNDILQNPAIANIANRFRSGNGPSIDELMNDPTIQDLAEQFGQGGARR